MSHLNKEYWNKRYKNENTPWDIGYASTPLIEYLKGIENKDLRILIPGAGYAHEAIFLHQNGFKNVWVCDWAEQAIQTFQDNLPDFPKKHLIVQDFFKLDLPFDLILEQTFFCALPRHMRLQYAKKTAQLLQNTNESSGKLVGLLFAQEFENEGPPFGGTAAEYRTLFSPYFEIEKMEISQNSIAPRAGKELFVTFVKK